MATNTGFLLMAGLGALLFLGRGGATKTTDEDNRLLTGLGRGGPMPPAFDLQSYVDSLFGETATVPVQPPMMFFYPPTVVVTSSGVPGTSKVAPEIITATTKVQIGGDGGETITASALAVLRSEQIAKQEFEAAANVQPRTWAATVDANRIEEERQKKFARDLIAKNRAAQAAETREQQENIQKGLNRDVISAGQSIIVAGAGSDLDVDFTPQYSETFVISGGMDSPALVGSEYDDPGPEYYAPSVTVHEVTAAYDIGF